MLTMSGGKTLGCLAIEADRDWPVSTSERTSLRTLARALFSVWSARIDRARSKDRPELIIVANCRDITARSLSLTPLPNGSVISMFMPRPDSRTLMGA